MYVHACVYMCIYVFAYIAEIGVMIVIVMVEWLSLMHYDGMMVLIVGGHLRELNECVLHD